MKRVVFLDIDGVLNSNFQSINNSEEISDGTLIDDEKAELLARIIKNTNCEIILHSGWRFWFDDKMTPITKEAEDLVGILAAHGLHIDGKTPDLTTPEIRETKKFSKVKADEILLWLEKNQETHSWIVIDDLDLGNDLVLSHQIRPDPSVGLTENDVLRATEMLMSRSAYKFKI